MDPLLIEITSKERIEITAYNSSLARIGNFKLSELMEPAFNGLHIKQKHF